MNTKQYNIIKATIANDFSIKNGFAIAWEAENFGFGLLTLRHNGEETILETECMSPEFCKAVFDKFFETIKLINI
jgi:hypothetical protein